MSFPRYPKYKDSGVEWLGQVPEHWDVQRLKSLVEEPLKYGANESAEDEDRTQPRFVRITDIDDSGGLHDDTFKSLPLAVAQPYLLKEGDVLLARSGATVGKSFIYSKQWGTACFAGYLIRARLKHAACLARWLYYFCQTNEYWGYVVGSQIQSTIQNVSAEKYANLYMPLPCISDQTHITAFLDQETAKIDALVAEQQRLMELLKEKRQAVISHAVTKGLNPKVALKPSGIEWLDDVPAHWEVRRLKHISPFITVGIVVNPSTYVADDGLPFIYGGDIREGLIDWENSRRISRESSEANSKTRLKAGDLLTVRVGAPGVTAVVPSECEGGNCASVMLVRQGVFNSHWLCYAMNTRIVRFQVEVVQYGAAQEQFNIAHAVNFWTPTPPREEQGAIVKHLDTEITKLDTLTAEAQRAIDLLQERRTALISAAVTGQIDVRKN